MFLLTNNSHFHITKKAKCINENVAAKIYKLLCTNDEHFIAKIYKRLLKFEIEEQIKECMIKWTKTLVKYTNNGIMEDMWLKGLRFTLCYNITETFYKMMYRWYMSSEKLSRMCKGT